MIGWIDLETTGLNPDRHYVLEVGFILTDDDLEEQFRFHAVLRMPPFGRMLEPVVLEMHTANGLLLECEASLSTAAQVEQRLLHAFANEGYKPSTFPMAGSTISFDRSFLRTWMPDLEAFFHYRNIDVSTLKRCAEMWRPDLEPPTGRNAHRAISDIEDSIAAAAYYRSALFLKENP